jgi:uncharacterized membrane protein (DUF373 family)
MDAPKESLIEKTKDPLIRYLNQAVIICVKVLAVLMVIVIWLALIDVIVHMIHELNAPPLGLFKVETLIATLGNFLLVLIAIEIFLNIVFYLKQDAIHVPLVLATALTAVARKIIIFDYATINPLHIFGAAAVIFSLGLTYWLITKKESA